MKTIKMEPAPCILGMSDGSERGCYVPQSYLLKTLGRPHGIINLMYEYFPGAPGWPNNDEEKRKDLRIFNGQYTNGYFHYMANEPDGGTWSEPFLSMRDIRRYGQDINLTITFDLNTGDEDLIRMAQDLRRFGRLFLRINHECNGRWFSFNMYHSYKEVSDFFIRVHNIMKEHAPNVLTNLCLNGWVWNKENGKCLGEDGLGPAIRIADIISYDQYNALHFAWPDCDYDPVRFGTEADYTPPEGHFYIIDDDVWFDALDEFHETICSIRGRETDIYLGEFNKDAECIGLQENGDWITQVYNRFAKEKIPYLKGIVFYHFRDRGGLGLEYEYNEERSRFRGNPALASYRQAILDPWFQPAYKAQGKAVFPLTLEWTDADNSTGLEWVARVPENVNGCLIRGLDNFHGIISVNEFWFYHTGEGSAPEISEALRNTPEELLIRLFATPPQGENSADSPDLYSVIIKEPPFLEFS